MSGSTDGLGEYAKFSQGEPGIHPCERMAKRAGFGNAHTSTVNQEQRPPDGLSLARQGAQSRQHALRSLSQAAKHPYLQPATIKGFLVSFTDGAQGP